MKRTDDSSWHADPDALLDVVRRTHAGDSGGPPPDVPGYASLREVARGGQSVVYRATELATGADVAVKVLAPGVLGSETSELRFEREFHALKALHHPHVVAGRACGRTADGRRWLAMDFVDGPRLDEWIAHRRGDRAAALELFEAVARAVQHAHQRGVLHRDLKPSNVRIDAAGAPRVLDFGIAKVELGDADATRLLTVSRQFLGTPGYAAPEQVAGRLDEVDVRTDVHALGVLLYELLVGRPPYAADGGLAATLTAIERAPPPRPSRLAPDVDAELDAIVVCALAKRPTDRYQSVDALLADLDRRRRGLPVAAHPPGAFYELRKWIGRNRLLFGLAAALVVLVTSLGATAFVLLSRERETRAAKERLSDYLLGLLLSADPFRSADPARSLDELLTGAADRLRVELADDPAEQARLLNVVGIHHRTAARYGEAEEALAEALRLRRALHDGDHEEVAESLTELASLRMFVDRTDEAAPMLREAVAMRRRLAGGDHPSVALPLSRLGQLLTAERRLDEARPLLEEALRIRRAALDEGDPATIASMHQLSQLHLRAGDPTAARALQEQAQALREAHGAPAPSLAAGLVVLGDVALAEGDVGGAVRAFRRAVDLSRDALGAGHEDTATARGRLAAALARSGATDRALAEAEEALAVVRRSLPDTHPTVLALRVDVAVYRLELGALDSAEEELRLALDDAPGGVPALAAGLERLAIARLDRGETSAAEELFRLALGQCRVLGDAPKPRTAGVLGSLAWIASGRGAHATAAERLTEAAALLAGEPESRRERAHFLARLAEERLADGDEAAARQALEEAASVRRATSPANADGGGRAARLDARTGALIEELSARLADGRTD